MKSLWLISGLALFLPMVVPAQTKTVEVQMETPDQKEALKQMNALLVFLLDPTRNIFRDDAQKELLSPDLLKLVLEARDRQVACAQRHPDEPVTEANNAIFLHAWDPPTEIKIAKLYTEEGRISFLTEFKWGPDTNYPGESRDAVFTFRKVGDTWKLEDVNHPGNPMREAVLISTFLKETWHD